MVAIRYTRVMTIKSHSLPIKFRLILGYLYYIVFASSLVGAVQTFGTTQAVFAGFDDVPTGIDELVSRIIMGVTAIATIGLAIWTIRLIHLRSAQAGVGFALLNLVSYGLYTIAPTVEGIPSLSAIIGGLAILALDIVIMIFLLRSKEAKRVLSK